jgi:hypothetical protein
MEELLERINYGYDGLIRSIVIKSFRRAEVRISIIDSGNNQWANLKITLDDIIEFKVAQAARTSNLVLSDGIKMKAFESNYFIDFSPYSEQVETVDDFRKSDIYFASKIIDWVFEPYSEE